MPTILERLGRPPVGKITVHSALNPILWSIVVTPICYIAAYRFRHFEPAMYFLLSIGSLPIVFSCLGFAFFALKHPEKLQSENFQLRHEAMQLIKQKGVTIDVDASTLEAIADPLPAGLPSSEEGVK